MKVPYKCMRNGVSCAYRTRFSGGIGETMCGYLYYTDDARGHIENGEYRESDTNQCEKWAAYLPKGIKKNDKRDINEDISDCAYNTEHSGGDNELYAAGL